MTLPNGGSLGDRKHGPIVDCKDDGTLDYIGDETTLFVLLWNDWSTAEDRKQVYRAAWEKSRHSASALAFIKAVAKAKGVPVPEHITDYLTKHRDFSGTFHRAFKKVRKHNWRLSAVVDQTNLGEFPPEVHLLKNAGSQVVMLYIVGDPTV